MYTETDLREALQVSAARADELLTEPEPGGGSAPQLTGTVLLQLSHSHKRPSRYRGWLPAVAAAAVIAAVGTGVFVAAGSGHSKHDPAGVSAASHRPVTSTHAHAAVALNNLITVSETDGNGHAFGPAGGPELWTVGGATAVNIIALPATTPFDPKTQITDAQRVQVAGTSGYYGKASASLSDPAGGAGKWGGPKATLAWRAANGTWIFIQAENHDVNLPLATLLSRYEQLGITATPGPLPRLPFRAGWLPDGLAVTSIDWSPDLQDVTLSADTKSVEINLFQGIYSGTGQLHAPGVTPSTDPHAVRNTGDTHLTVIVHGYAQATAQRILDSLDLSRLHAAQSTWWTVTDAVNS